MKTTKYQRILEAVSADGQMLNKFVEHFGGVEDSQIEDPQVEAELDRFASDNKIELLEYDISKLNLKVGTILDLTDLEDMLELTRGQFRKELSLYANDGGSISVQIKGTSSSNVNGIKVDVKTIDGDSKLANESSIVKALTNTLENGDLSFLLENEEEPELELTPMPFEKMVEQVVGKFGNDEMKQLIEQNCSQDGRQKLAESNENDGSEFTLNEEDITSLTEAMKPMFEMELPEDYTRHEGISQEELKGILKENGWSASMLESCDDICSIYDNSSDCCAVYNATTESLDCKNGSEIQTFMESAVSKDQQQLFGQAYAIRIGEQPREGASEEVLALVDGEMSTEEMKKFASTSHEGLPEKITEGELVRVKKESAKDFNNFLKMNGVDFSEATLENGAFNEFYINDKKREDVKKLVADAFDKKIMAVLVERVKENEEGDENVPKQYSDVIVKNGDGEILLLQRNENDDLEPNKFGFAGGKIEEGETPEQAGVRELLEETGINVDEVKPVKIIENPDGSTSHYFETTVDDDQYVTLSGEHQGVKWVKPEELLEMEDIIFDNNDRYSELCSERMTENDNKIDIGQKVTDAGGTEWEATSINDEGIVLKSGEEEKTLKFDEVDSFLGK